MPTKIQQGSTPEALRKFFAIVGGIPGMSLDEVVVPVALVADLSGAPEPTSDRLSWGNGQAAAVAGQNGHVQLLNPTGSGAIVQVQRMWVSPGANLSFSVRDHNTALTTAVANTGYRDRRQVGTPVAQVRQQTNAGLLGTVHASASALALDAKVLELDLTLAPGDGVLVAGTAVNVSIAASWFWSERSVTVEGQ